MKALDLSEGFFHEIALPSLREEFPELCDRVGAGLMGNGSECYGFDDEISRDHDWGVEFYVWLTEEDFPCHAEALRGWRERLRSANPQTTFRTVSDYGLKETVVTPERFFRSMIGFGCGPQTMQDWRRIPESNLAMAVNGRVFVDPVGELSRTRELLMGYYPEDLRLKKIAARCLSAAQTGQYNFLRCAQRGDVVARELALSRFVQDAISLAFLLNRRYMPYYKWSYRAMLDLPELAPDIAPDLAALWSGEPVDGQLDPGNRLVREVPDDVRYRAIRVERICARIVAELRRQGLSDSTSTFLVHHGERVQAKIVDPELSRIPTQYE